MLYNNHQLSITTRVQSINLEYLLLYTNVYMIVTESFKGEWISKTKTIKGKFEPKGLGGGFKVKISSRGRSTILCWNNTMGGWFIEG